MDLNNKVHERMFARAPKIPFVLARRNHYLTLMGTDTLSGVVTLSKSIFFPSEKGSTLKGKHLLHHISFDKIGLKNKHLS